MFLSSITEKNIYLGKNLKGVSRGIGISLKSQTVKYLLCVTNPSAPSFQTDFSVNVSCIKDIDHFITLQKFRSSFPKNSAKIFIGLPIFSYDGSFLGNILDVEMKNFTAIKLLTNQGACFPISSIIACSDAVILRKESPYPIGQRIPAGAISTFFDKNKVVSSIVTKPLLKEAAKKGTLVKLTLSLSPFNFDTKNQSLF